MPLASPCSGVCRIDAASGLCAGCRRTLDEIARWQAMGDGGRRVVWERLARHRADATEAGQPGAVGSEAADRTVDAATSPSGTPRLRPIAR